MKEKVQSALDNYVLAYTNNDKSLFRSLWDDQAIFEDPVGADPCIGIEAICEFWDFGHASGMEITPKNVETVICSNEGILKATMEVRNINEKPDEANEFFKTIPIGKVGDCKDDIGEAFCHLLSDVMNYITGSTIMIDGGQAYLR